MSAQAQASATDASLLSTSAASPDSASIQLSDSRGPVYVALSGKSGAGKTELARRLVQHFGIQRCSPGDIYRSVSRILFAEATKEAMNQLTLALRRLDPLCVLTAALRQVKPENGIVFDSMRFREDYAYFAAQNYLLVRVECDESVRARRLLSRGEVRSREEFEALELDETETDLDGMPFDVVLRNEGTDLELFLRSGLQAIRDRIGGK